MRVSLQDGDLDHIHVQRTRAEHTCVDSKETIESGEYAVSMQNKNYLVWLSIPAVDSLATRLQQFIDADDPDPDDYGFKVWRRGSNVKYAKRLSSPPSGECIGCGKESRKWANRFDFVDPDETGRVVTLHEECVEDYIAALERVWEQEELVAHFI